MTPYEPPIDYYDSPRQVVEHVAVEPESIHSSGEIFDPFWEDYYEANGENFDEEEDENWTIPSWLTTAGKGALEFGAGMVGQDAPKGTDSGSGGWM